MQANTKNTYYLDKVKKINEAGMVRDNVIEFELAKNNISPARCQELVEKSWKKLKKSWKSTYLILLWRSLCQLKSPGWPKPTRDLKSIPKCGTLDQVIKVTSYDITLMTWWNISRMFRLTKISDMLYHISYQRPVVKS